MKLNRLKQSSDFAVKKWISEELELTPYQKRLLDDKEVVRFSPFYFYEKKEPKKISFWWRLTFILLPFYLFLLYFFLPVNMVFTGHWGYSRWFIDHIHSKWMYNLNLH